MPYSIGKLLRVDLTHGTIQSESIDRELYRMYPGGKALAAYLLLKELPRGVEPLSPANILILATGLLTGAPFSTATRFTASARSPLTGTYGESEAGGFWGPELKNAGYEALVVYGRAEHPVYLSIRDDRAEIRDARHLWGREPLEAQETIRAELGDKLARVLQIGIGGENRVRFAAITNDLRHFNGRNGMGAVMGSKNLKAVAVRGTGKYADIAADAKPILELGRVLAKKVKEQPQAWDLQNKGTPGAVSGLNAQGILPTHNFRQGAFEGVDNIKWEAYEKEILIARRSCYACAVRCKREVKVDDRYQVSENYGGPEYEAVGGFGSNCGIDDLQAIAKANELCNRFTLDAISTAGVVAFAMECFEHELITRVQTGGLDLHFGNAEAMVKLVEMIARREKIGDLLAEGVMRASEKIGGGAEFFALHVKGQELPMHDPRGKVGVGLGYAVNEAGADHLTSIHDTMMMNPESLSFKGSMPLGFTEALSPRDFSEKKVRQYGRLENWISAEKVTGLCFFGPTPRSYIQVDEVLTALRAATGEEWTVEDVLRVGERATNLARVFNIREGFSRADDRVPERLFTPLENGALAGVALSREEFERALTELYRFKGWDAETAAPTREKLRALGIEWAFERMRDEG